MMHLEIPARKLESRNPIQKDCLVTQPTEVQEETTPAVAQVGGDQRELNPEKATNSVVSVEKLLSFFEGECPIEDRPLYTQALNQGIKNPEHWNVETKATVFATLQQEQNRIAQQLAPKEQQLKTIEDTMENVEGFTWLAITCVAIVSGFVGGFQAQEVLLEKIGFGLINALALGFFTSIFGIVPVRLTGLIGNYWMKRRLHQQWGKQEVQREQQEQKWKELLCKFQEELQKNEKGRLSRIGDQTQLKEVLGKIEKNIGPSAYQVFLGQLKAHCNAKTLASLKLCEAQLQQWAQRVHEQFIEEQTGISGSESPASKSESGIVQ